MRRYTIVYSRSCTTSAQMFAVASCPPLARSGENSDALVSFLLLTRHFLHMNVCIINYSLLIRKCRSKMQGVIDVG